MNNRLLKAKRVERDIRQKDMADALDITQKSMCKKECSEVNKFRADEMLKVAELLGLSFDEFDEIFFDHRITERLIARENSYQNDEVELFSTHGKKRGVWIPSKNQVVIRGNGIDSAFTLNDNGSYEVEDIEVG